MADKPSLPTPVESGPQFNQWLHLFYVWVAQQIDGFIGLFATVDFVVGTSTTLLGAERIATNTSSITKNVTVAGQITWDLVDEYAQDLVGAMLVDTTSIDLVYNDAGGTFTAAIIDEYVQDLVGAMLVDSATIDFTYSDAGGTFTARSIIPAVPGGRLTLTTALPVMTSIVLGATTIRYTPYVHDRVPIYDGTSWEMRTFTERSNITTDSATGSAGPAAVANNSNYDLFIWDNGGTLTLTRGPLWTSDIARGTGAGTTELVRVNGVWMNAVSITNGPAAQRGTYLGSVRSNGTASIDWRILTSSSPAIACFLHVWNAYNRVDVSGFVFESADSWTYAVLSVWRSKNANDGNRVSFIYGLTIDSIRAENDGIMNCGSGIPVIGIGQDSTTVRSGTAGVGAFGALNLGSSAVATWETLPIGFHFFQAIELNAVAGAGTVTFFGDVGLPLIYLSGFNVHGRF